MNICKAAVELEGKCTLKPGNSEGEDRRAVRCVRPIRGTVSLNWADTAA